MTVPEAIQAVRQVGEIRVENGKLKVRYPQEQRVVLQAALCTLRECKQEALTLLAESPKEANRTQEPPPSLKGHAVELWCDHAGGRVFVVADEEDAQETIGRFGAHRGQVWTPGEIELVARIEDQAIRDEVAGFKRQIGACISPNAAGEGVSPEEWKAAALNRLFQEQGVTGQAGRITAATVRHGERKTGKS